MMFDRSEPTANKRANRNAAPCRWMVVALVLVAVAALIPTVHALSAGTRIHWVESLALESLSKISTTYRGYFTLAAPSAGGTLYAAPVDHTQSPPVVGPFEVLPDLDEQAGFGAVASFVVDGASGAYFFAHECGLWGGTLAPGSLLQYSAEAIGPSLLAKDGRLVYTRDDALHFGAILPVNGVFVESAVSPVLLDGPGPYHLAAGAGDGHLYLYEPGRRLLRSASSIPSLTSFTTFTEIPLPSDTPAGEWTVFGTGPDGRLFLAGDTGGSTSEIVVAHRDFPGSGDWTIVATGVPGWGGLNIEWSGLPEAYEVYVGAAASVFKGALDTWSAVPRGGRGPGTARWRRGAARRLRARGALFHDHDGTGGIHGPRAYFGGYP